MDIRRFFSENDVNDSIIEITGEEAYHLKKVLRVRVGTKIEITDGRGMLYYGAIDEFINDSVMVNIEKTEKFKESINKIIIAPSLLKRNTMNFMIEKLSEIGVNEITPVLFNRTELKPSEKIVQKWEKIAISSLKVNKQVWLTKINQPLRFVDFIKKYENFKNKIMLDINGITKVSNKNINNTIAIIGPPGDYIKSERDELLKNNFIGIKINSSILKVETAAISISAILKENELDIGKINGN